MDSNGDEVLGPVTSPSEVGISCIMDDGFLVTARYEGYFNDRNKANRWEVYLKAENPPVVRFGRSCRNRCHKRSGDAVGDWSLRVNGTYLLLNRGSPAHS